MASQNPKKPKSKKLNLNTKSQWKNILKDVEKKEVPIHVLEKLIVALKDGTQVVVDIKRLLAEGADPDLIADLVPLLGRGLAVAQREMVLHLLNTEPDWPWS